MIGLLFWAFLVLWVLAAIWLARRIARTVPQGTARIAAIGALTALFVALPVADEIIGGFQFRSLCAKNAVLNIDAEKISGKTVRLVIDPSNSDVADTAIQIRFSRLSFRDTNTNEELASYFRYTAQGGRLIRVLAGGHEITPLTVHPSTCSARLPDTRNFKLAN